MSNVRALIIDDELPVHRLRFTPRTDPPRIRVEAGTTVTTSLDREDASALLEFLRDWIQEQIGEPPY